MSTSIKIDTETKQHIQIIADKKHRSPHWIMLEAIRDYIKRYEVEEQFSQEALASWKSYKETGQHLTGQEVQDWLSTWGTDNEIEAPKCHK
ncbi:MAG: CopG family ribbon-helix-helix protein [gamma proteobacterium symbiont of Taylorina sp.]|nr:CopG family ribbon-helix-helix protein [gamma proteobacterium symbiont of Taylorina sp.]